MSNDIKIVDYIPEDGHLCCNCIHFKECPFDYICESLERLEKYEAENGEL